MIGDDAANPGPIDNSNLLGGATDVVNFLAVNFQISAAIRFILHH